MILTDPPGKVCGQTKPTPFGIVGKGLMLHIAVFVGLRGHNKAYPPRGR